VKQTAAFKLAVAQGLELAPEEKGGATYKARLYQEKPAHWYALVETLNPESAGSANVWSRLNGTVGTVRG
jgi:hypothetical protein